MDWNCFFTVSVAILLLSVVTAVLVDKKLSRRSGWVITPFRVLYAGLVLAVYTAVLPMYSVVFAGTRWALIKTVLFAVQGTLQVFTGSAGFSLMQETVTEDIGSVAAVYTLYLSLLSLASPVFTFGFVASFFKNISAAVRFFLEKRRELYIFSELNEKSVIFAEDIKRHHPKAAIVFTDVFEKNEEASYEMVGRAREVGAICFKKDILDLHFGVHSKKKSLYFFLIGSDESENIRQALRLIDKYGMMPHSHLYAFTIKTESDLLLSYNKGLSMKVHRVNETQSLVYRLLYEKGTELFQNALPGENGKKNIHAVLVGLGLHGTEMLKALTWYCQMDGYHPTIDAFDRDPLSAERFSALCPELLDEKHNGAVLPGEAEYTLRIHSGADAETKSFLDAVGAMRDVTYVFVALGSDADNIKIAARLRMLFARAGIKPVIQAVIYNPDEKDALSGITNYRGEAYDITCVGDLPSSFSEKNILHSDLEKAAFAVHRGYCAGDAEKEKEFWQYEYNYRSSMATAIHNRAKRFCGVPGSGKPETERTPEEKAVFGPLEKRRWNAYMRGEGYIFSGSTDKLSRSDLAKMHNDLVSYYSLSEKEKAKDNLVGSV